MAQNKRYATFFIYPFRAQVAGKDIAERVQALQRLGHEIGKHTHFYAGEKIDKSYKLNDLSETNIEHCLRRDFQTLHSMKVDPKGFTAGAWLVNDRILDTLVDLGFVYDCSARLPKPSGTADSPLHRWLTKADIFTNTAGRLMCLPTTCSLGEWFKWGYKVQIDSHPAYRLVYLHDYDLITLKGYLLTWLFLMTSRRTGTVTALALANALLAEQSS